MYINNMRRARPMRRRGLSLGDISDTLSSAGSAILNFWKQGEQNQGAINQANAQLALQQQQQAYGAGDNTTLLLVGAAVVGFMVLRKKRHS